MKELEQLQQSSAEGRDIKLQPFIELAKQITDSPICEIEITDNNYLFTLAHSVTDLKIAPQNYSICHDTLQKNGSHEVEDLLHNDRYKNLSFVQEAPRLRYYFGIKLTTSTGKDIGTISVSDTIPKRITKEQKVQFKILSHAIMTTIEGEYRYNNVAGELKKLKATMHKLNHDITSPINGIILMAGLLIDETEEGSDQAEEFNMIKESAETLYDIINRGLTSADTDLHEEMLLEKKPLSNILEKLEALYYPLTLDKKLSNSFEYQLEREILIPFEFSIKLIRIIGNLVSNAVKFTPENGSVDVIFNETGRRDRTLLNITVKDTGRSMSAGQITSFNSGKPVARTVVNGNDESYGTGLQHVHQMISEEGGSVNIESGTSSGTIFSISLPLPSNEKKTVPFVVSGFAKPMVNGQKEKTGK
jgi:signal transduction histidine kinase